MKAIIIPMKALPPTALNTGAQPNYEWWSVSEFLFLLKHTHYNWIFYFSLFLSYHVHIVYSIQ